MTKIRFARPIVSNTVLAVAALVAGLAAQPALAGSPAAGTAEIRLDRAMLAGDDSTIHARIAAAARQVCRAEGSDLTSRMQAHTCYLEAIKTAETRLLALRETAHGAQPVLAAVDPAKAR